MTIDEIRDNFELLDEWDDRYRYVIELGRTLEPMSEAEHSAENKVNGCVSQVWLSRQIDRSGNDEPRLKYLGDSDAHIVRGLIAILLTLYSGRTPQQILATDAIAVFDEFGFRDHLTPQRSNGLRSMLGPTAYPIEQAVIDKNEQLFGNPDRAELRSTNLVWPPLLRKLDRIDPGYRN